MAEAKVRGYVDGINKDYAEVLFLRALARVPSGILQDAVMQAAFFETAYPKEKGFCWFCVIEADGSWWVNGMEGHLFTEEKIALGILEQPAGTDYVSGEIGEPFPSSRVIHAEMTGRLTYRINGYFSNVGLLENCDALDSNATCIAIWAVKSA
jgi:hypothetical protein